MKENAVLGRIAQTALPTKKMKNIGFFRDILIFVLCLSFVGCASNKENIKKQAEAKRNLGEAYMNQRNYTFALKTLLESQQLDPKDPLVYYDLGIVYMAKERLDLAIENYRTALKIKPNLAPAINALGNAYLREGKWDMAIEQFDRLTGDLLYATPHFPLYGLGIAYFNKHEYEKARGHLEEAVKLQPNFFEAYWWLGKTNLELGRIQESREALDKAIGISPNFTPAYIVMAQAFLVTGEIAKAEQAYQKVLEIAPDSPDAKQAEKELKQLKP